MSSNDSNGNRTRVTAVKGRCLNRLTMEPFSLAFQRYNYIFFVWCCQHQTPRVGLEPTTTRLTAECSTIELSRKNYYFVIIRRSFASSRYSNFFLYLQNRTRIKTFTSCESFRITSRLSSNLRLSPRPISKCQLNALLHLHLIPIYLVVFKGSY